MPLTRKAFAYLAIAYAFVFLSLALAAAWLVLFALLLAILIFASFRFPTAHPNPISVTRQIHPVRSIVGEDVNVTLKVTNLTNRILHSFYLEDQLPNGMVVGGGSNQLTLSLRGGESSQFEYLISKPKRGNYTIGPTRVRFSDNLGLREVDTNLSNMEELIVVPRIEELGIIDLKGKRFGPWPGLVPSRRLGAGSEFFELAPYVAGVDLRRVNWKASARLGMLVVNESEGEQVIDVLVVLDCYEGVRSKLFDYDALEFQVSFTASLCAQLIAQGNRVGLAVYGAIRTWVSPGFGKRHLLRLLDSLAVVKPGPATLPIKYVLESIVATILPARSLVLLISPMLGDDVADLIESISAQGYGLVCFSPSPSGALETDSEPARIARTILALERKLRIKRAGKSADVIQLSPELSVKPLLRVRARWNKP